MNHDVLQEIKKKLKAVTDLMAQPEVATDIKRMAELGREHLELKDVVETINEYEGMQGEIADLEEMIKSGDDPDLVSMAEEELADLQTKLPAVHDRLQLKLIPKDPEDSKNAIIEVRAGTGGDEAALFAGDLFRLYSRYAETNGWKVEVMETSSGTQGGYKEIIFEMKGGGVFGSMKYESGVHRVQRVPATESSGRIHTSAATVAVLPEAEEVDIDIHANDLKIDVYRSSGPGGQSVNTTDSAVRITHIPTGLVVTCQDEKSQHKNKDKALRVLRSRLYEQEIAKRNAERGEARRSMVGSGDRSGKIRTYNWPQDRVTDHRLTGDNKNYPLQRIISGDLDPIIHALRTTEHADRLANLGE